MTIDQRDWEFQLSFDSVLPQSLDDLLVKFPRTLMRMSLWLRMRTWIGEMENFLMQDDDGYVDHDHQIADLERILLPPDSSPPSTTPPPAIITPDKKDSSDSNESDSNSVPERAETNPDCLSQNQIRKLRNRDAALKSDWTDCSIVVMPRIICSASRYVTPLRFLVAWPRQSRPYSCWVLISLQQIFLMQSF